MRLDRSTPDRVWIADKLSNHLNIEDKPSNPRYNSCSETEWWGYCLGYENGYHRSSRVGEPYYEPPFESEEFRKGFELGLADGEGDRELGIPLDWIERL